MAVATNALVYNSYVQAIAALAVEHTTTISQVVYGTSDWFNVLIPQALNYAELRIQRDLDLQQSLTSNSYALSISSNALTISVNDFVTVQTISIVSPSGAITPLLPTSKEFLQNVYGDPTSLASPQYFAMYGGDLVTAGNTSTNIIVGPYPDAAYPVQVTGTIRLPSLYKNATTMLADTGTTFISTYLPDLLIQASMILVAQYQRNFTPTSNDPEMPGSYELQYGNLLKGAIVEEARKRFQSSAWASQSPALVASASR